MPTIEVRFQNLEAEAEVRVGSSGLPTVLNSVVNTIEVRTRAIALHPLLPAYISDSERRSILNLGRCASCSTQEAANALHILPSRKRIMPILHDVSGIIKPRR
jgi:hypothetical protein